MAIHFPDAFTESRVMTENPNKIKIRLLLADDHPVVRAGVRSYLSANEHVEIVGEAADGEEAVSKARELQPDIVFMDTFMPRMNGFEATKLLHEQAPGVKVLMHSVYNSRDFILQIIRSGARGYVPKSASLDELNRAIEAVNQGETYYNSDVARHVFAEHSRGASGRGRRAALDLSEREVQVLRRIAEGKSNREIAMELKIGVRTIETHRERIMQKLQIHNVAGLIKFAIARGVATIE
jgi:two-component system nitrate/nitrite response regulator NarL